MSTLTEQIAAVKRVIEECWANGYDDFQDDPHTFGHLTSMRAVLATLEGIESVTQDRPSGSTLAEQIAWMFLEMQRREMTRIRGVVDADVSMTKAILATLEGMAAPGDGTRLWLWRNGDHYLAYEHEYPCYPDGGDPLTLGEPIGYAILKPSSAPFGSREWRHANPGRCWSCGEPLHQGHFCERMRKKAAKTLVDSPSPQQPTQEATEDAMRRSQRLWYTRFDGQEKSPGWIITAYAEEMDRFAEQELEQVTAANARWAAKCRNMFVEIERLTAATDKARRETIEALTARSTLATILDHDTAADTVAVGIWFETPQDAEDFLRALTPPNPGDA